MDQNCWILVPDHGIRCVQSDEMIKLKGLQNSGYSSIPYPVLLNIIDQHVWASIYKASSPLLLPSPRLQLTPHQEPTPDPIPPTTDSLFSQWNWP